jgi:hypothetical protein
MTNEIMVKMVLDAWNKQVSDANKLFDSLSDEQLMKEVAPGRNRGIYLLGHLAAVNDRMLPLLGYGEAKFPKLHEPFLTKPDKAVAEIPSVAELRKYWTSSCEELSKHFKNETPETWFGKHTSVSAEDFAKEPHRNKLNVVLGRTGHLQSHLGQLVFLKSKA